MTTRYTVTLSLGELALKSEIAGLLIPVAESQAFQYCENIRFAGINNAQNIRDEKNTQSAWYLSAEMLTQALDIKYDFASENQSKANASSAVYQTGEVNEWTRSLGYSVDNLKLNKQQLSCRKTLTKTIVHYIAEKFQYVSEASTGELGNLTCDLLTGNCIDINNAFMTLLSEAGIEHCYFSGIYVQHDGKASHGWHCWVATHDGDKTCYWDIAQNLKSGNREIKPALNPVGGIRFALSQGTNLCFKINSKSFNLKKFPLPTLLYNDGTSELIIPDITLKNWN